MLFRSLGRLVLEERLVENPDPAMIVGALVDQVRAEGLSALRLGERGRALLDRVAFLRAVDGDDWPDLPLLTRAAFACAPANAHAEVRAVAHHVTAVPGGQGAAREFCDLLLMAAGRYGALFHGHLQTLDGR